MQMQMQMMDNSQLVYGHFGVPSAAKAQWGTESAMGGASTFPSQTTQQGEQTTPQLSGQNPPPQQQQQTIFNQAATAGWNMNPGAGWQVNPMQMVPNGAMMLPIQPASHGMAVAGQAMQPQQQVQQFQSPSASPSASPSGTIPSTSNSPAAKKNARKKKGKKSRPSVFVGGIRTDITEREIRNFFGMFGKINHVTIKEGYAFLDFAEDAAARAAVEKCNGYMYDGKPLGVRIQDETNRRTAQEAKKQGQNVSMVFKRIEEEQGVGMPGMAGAQGMPGMQGMPPQQQQQLQQQQLLGGVRPQMPMDVDARATALAP